MSEPVSPLDNNTEWLTDARDAKKGMDVVAYDEDNDTLLRERIERVVDHSDGSYLYLENGTTIPVTQINQTPKVIVE